MPISPVCDDKFLDDLRAVRAQIKDNWSLCEFMGKSERECMVAQTIHAAIINLDKHGEPFSFRGDGVFSNQGNGLADNGSAYSFLLGNGYFVEDTRQERIVIFPTQKLLNELKTFFSWRQDGSERVAVEG